MLYDKTSWLCRYLQTSHSGTHLTLFYIYFNSALWWILLLYVSHVSEDIYSPKNAGMSLQRHSTHLSVYSIHWQKKCLLNLLIYLSKYLSNYGKSQGLENTGAIFQPCSLWKRLRNKQKRKSILQLDWKEINVLIQPICYSEIYNILNNCFEFPCTGNICFFPEAKLKNAKLISRAWGSSVKTIKGS